MELGVALASLSACIHFELRVELESDVSSRERAADIPDVKPACAIFCLR